MKNCSARNAAECLSDGSEAGGNVLAAKPSSYSGEYAFRLESQGETLSSVFLCGGDGDS